MESQTFELNLTDIDKKIISEKSDIPTPSLDDSAIELDLNFQPQKKRGRKSGIEKEAIKATEDESNQKLASDFIETIKPTLRLGLDLAFARLPNPQPTQDIEMDMFCTTLIPVAKKYASKLQQISPEFIALAALAVIVIPRAIPSQNFPAINLRGKDE